MQPYHLSKIKRPSEIGIIFDGTIQTDTYMAHATLNALDKDRQDNPPYLTDIYSMKPGLAPDQPVDMTPIQGTPAEMNTDGFDNSGNVRFRHIANTQADALMVDGHVQAFRFDKNSKTTDLLRKNVFVNLDQAIPR